MATRTPEIGAVPPGADGGREQGNFELAANSDYNSRVPAGTRESLRRRRISKLALNAHKVSPFLLLAVLPRFPAGCWMYDGLSIFPGDGGCAATGDGVFWVLLYFDIK